MQWLKNLWKRLLKLIGLQSSADQLRERMTETKVVVQAAKTPTYHEIVPQHDGTHMYRIYRRSSSELLEEGGAQTQKSAQQKLLAAIRKYEGGGK